MIYIYIYIYIYINHKNLLQTTEYSSLTLTMYPQPKITCSKLTIETLEQGMKYVQR